MSNEKKPDALLAELIRVLGLNLEPQGLTKLKQKQLVEHLHTPVQQFLTDIGKARRSNLQGFTDDLLTRLRFNPAEILVKLKNDFPKSPECRVASSIFDVMEVQIKNPKKGEFKLSDPSLKTRALNIIKRTGKGDRDECEAVKKASETSLNTTTLLHHALVG
ncbi:MAG: hypothetical protein V1838_04245 [Patescibacteria group bacterium]